MCGAVKKTKVGGNIMLESVITSVLISIAIVFLTWLFLMSRIEEGERDMRDDFERSIKKEIEGGFRKQVEAEIYNWDDPSCFSSKPITKLMRRTLDDYGERKYMSYQDARALIIQHTLGMRQDINSIQGSLRVIIGKTEPSEREKELEALVLELQEELRGMDIKIERKV